MLTHLVRRLLLSLLMLALLMALTFLFMRLAHVHAPRPGDPTELSR
jgi:hypothetical protein